MVNLANTYTTSVADSLFLSQVSASTTYATKEELGGAGLNPFFLSLL